MNAYITIAKTHRKLRTIDQWSNALDQCIFIKYVVVAALDLAEPLMIRVNCESHSGTLSLLCKYFRNDLLENIEDFFHVGIACVLDWKNARNVARRHNSCIFHLLK